MILICSRSTFIAETKKTQVFDTTHTSPFIQLLEPGIGFTKIPSSPPDIAKEPFCLPNSRYSTITFVSEALVPSEMAINVTGMQDKARLKSKYKDLMVSLEYLLSHIAIVGFQVTL